MLVTLFNFYIISYVLLLYTITKSEFIIWETNDLYRTYDYKKMRRESPIIMLDDVRSLPRRVLKEAIR